MTEVIATNLGLQTEQVKAKKIWNERDSGIAPGRVFPLCLRKVVLFFCLFLFLSFFLFSLIPNFNLLGFKIMFCEISVRGWFFFPFVYLSFENRK